MLFAVWTENRATEETERISVQTPSIRSVSLQELSRTNTTSLAPMPLDSSENRPTADIPVESASVKDIKTVNFEVMEEQRADDSSHWDGGRPPVFKSTFQEICCIISIVCGQLTNVLSGRGDCWLIIQELAHAQQITIPALIPYFHFTTGQQAWVSAAQGIPAGCFLLLFGRLADIFGRKRVLLVSLTSHALGGVVCGAAPHVYHCPDV